MSAEEHLGKQFDIVNHLEGVHGANMDELVAHQNLFKALWGGTVHEHRLNDMNIVEHHHNLLHNLDGKMSSKWDEGVPHHDIHDLSSG